MAVKLKKVMWMCSDVEGVTSGVDPNRVGCLLGKGRRTWWRVVGVSFRVMGWRLTMLCLRVVAIR
ncbi:unnamed protein product [Eruca vesicaria subsp. sativa]|uniref:Uncharacterized protein n=1 Tax=Eruca vesicaria subsp. sativa TaxID=29727 RepID=A0ABC8IVF1_ERUVS|nr:unnamed protein product [Eruca vesicaria subsp. sativa]